ncbi:MAG: LysR family transcriptional regulator [Candidatus Eisenbacteria bacterium]|nr:LysR family transcriptional regulator [Candidatus Eisenbacteria bacterium]
MSTPDLNLLAALDVLLSELSVARAARRLRLSPSAMSRTLARLREATGDPLLVRAGRGLVPTPRALELRERAGRLVQEGSAVLSPVERLDPAKLVRTFTLRSSDGFVENFGPRLLARVGAEAPGVRLRFLQKSDKDSAPLREGSVDLETGVLEPEMSPELRAKALFRDRFVGVTRSAHPLARGKLTLARYLAGRHVSISRRGEAQNMVDSLLESLGHRREIAAIVGGFSAAIALARNSDLIATVPERHTQSLRAGMHRFRLPFEAPEFTVSLIWHPRMDADAAHRWLRGCVSGECGGRGSS